MISIQELSYQYSGTLALDNVTIDIPTGSITALVGPNGAGKTTLMRCLTALTLPSAGRILMDDIDIATDPHFCHRNTGFLADNFGLYESLTVFQSLHYYAMAHGINTKEEVMDTISKVQLDNKIHEPLKNLSRGMRQRVGIAQSIIHRPKYLILDEPASGLDPEARIELANLFKTLNEAGMTLIVSSHILAELDQYANNLLILKNGRIVESDFGLNVDNTSNKTTYIIYAENIDKISSIQNDEIFILLGIEQGKATISIDDSVGKNACLKYFIESGLEITEFYKENNNIQDAYLRTIKNVQ